jgi:glucose/arabinose dehydrogenase
MSNASRHGRASRVALAALACTVAGCGSPGLPAASSLPVTPTAAASAAPAGGPSEAPGATPTHARPTVVAPGADLERPDLASVRVALEVAASGFQQPLFVTSVPDGTGRLFVAEQGGRVRIVRDGTVLPTPFLDISDRVAAGGERGLLGLAFPPGFGDNRPEVYVHYSNLDGNTTIASVRVPSGTADVADPATERIVLTEAQPYANHNGGWIGFDADGMLLIALGDGGSGGDPENRASRLDTLLGKMLRIDVLGAAGGQPYVIPADNPFVGRPDARPEILHDGLRNPFRDSVDPATGDLWIGDVGQSAWEEVDVARAGARGLDFGWRRWEGHHCYNPPQGCDPTGVTQPVTEYPHPAGCSVIGGVVYHGDAIPALRGAYLFSDYCAGTLSAIDAGFDAPQAPIVLAETHRAISSIGIDEEGEVYLTDLSSGDLLRLVPGS